MLETNDFKSAQERLQLEQASRDDMSKSLIEFGVPILDLFFRGILRHDLILLGAKTGSGKTECAVKIASHAASLGKKVFFFALEAEQNEIERRMRYQAVSRAYYDSGGTRELNYVDWCLKRYPELRELESSIESDSQEVLKNLYTFYRTQSDFRIQDFEYLMNAIGSKADLIIVDHLHYFDFNLRDENTEVSSIIKKIRDLVLLHGVPVIAIAHLRKIGRDERQLVPELEDFHGTSNLGKIVTKAIILASGGPLNGTNEYVTYMRCAKFRLNGSAGNFIGKTTFDVTKNAYTNQYKFGHLSPCGQYFEEVANDKLPAYLRKT